MQFEQKKSLGQHFLNSPYIPEKMTDAAAIEAGDIVLEIGPGTGALTRVLLERGARVHAVETDARAIEVLEREFEAEIKAKKLVIFNTDMRTSRLEDFRVEAHNYKVVANIPYYLSGLLFRTFLETPYQPSLIVFLVQKEVAERIARDKKESLLSLSVKAYGTPSYISTVKRTHFSPPPNVDSAIIRIDDISHKKLQGVEDSYFFEILHLGFASRRKQLLGNLSKRFERAALMHIFSTLGINETVRGEDLTIEMWLTLVRNLKQL